ncbi:S1C family serine protease [Patescibacteria group bacterium]
MKQENNKKKKSYNFLALVLLVVVLGFLAGISGEFFTRYYLSNLGFFRDLYFTETDELGDRDIIIREPKKVVVEQELRINQIKNELQNSVAGIYQIKSAGDDLLDKVFLPDDYAGQAMILTSDGWLLTDSNVSIGQKDDLVISHQQNIYEIDKMFKDDLSGIVFMKINAENLPVIKLVEWEKLTPGQQVLVYNSHLDQLDLVYIKNKRSRQINNKYDLVQSSQVLDKRILLSDGLNDDFIGSALVNFQGEIIGILDSFSKEYNKAIPLYFIQPIISQVLKGEEIKQPYLGINYLNLAQIYGLSEEDRQNQDQGAMIWPNQKDLAIEEDSPLADLLEIGDIIISIEDQRIDKVNDLLDIILQYKSGQQIRLKYLHDNEEQEAVISL